jgi:hypothetical protein
MQVVTLLDNRMLIPQSIEKEEGILYLNEQGEAN